jgi:lipoprotein Spr
MKKLVFVSVALSVFTVTSVSAQKKVNFFADMNLKADGIVYTPAEMGEAAPKSSITKFAEKYVSPVLSVATEMCSPLQFKYAQLLNRDVESLTNFSLFSFIDKWWGTRYRYGGTGKSGIDCSAFTGLLMTSVFSIAMPRTAREQYAVCEKLKEDEMLEGDLVFFNTRGGVSHVGVYLGEGYFVHSSCSNGVTISSLDDAYYRKRFISGGRPMSDDCTAKMN